MEIVKAVTADAADIAALIARYAEKGILLERPVGRVSRNIREFFVCRHEGRVAGCGALQVFGEKLAEIRSLAVDEGMQGKGIGGRIVKACLEEARRLGVESVFVLTYATGFFSKFGFVSTDKTNFPHKIWLDCMNCPKFPDCDEEAMICSVGSGDE